jgi:hypothetical protein
VGTSSIE